MVSAPLTITVSFVFHARPAQPQSSLGRSHYMRGPGLHVKAVSLPLTGPNGVRASDISLPASVPDNASRQMRAASVCLLQVSGSINKPLIQNAIRPVCI
jgi:hypothetical protein